MVLELTFIKLIASADIDKMQTLGHNQAKL